VIQDGNYFRTIYYLYFKRKTLQHYAVIPKLKNISEQYHKYVYIFIHYFRLPSHKHIAQQYLITFN
jgi:ubiquinone/menaquinone biosynthesis C-methylase UbiE